MSAFLQVIAFAVLIVAALVVGGVVPIGAFTSLLPTNWISESPLPARSTGSTEGAGGGGSGGGGARGGYGSVEGQAETQSERRGSPASPAEERERAEREERAAARRPDCDSELRVNRLSLRYDEWSRQDLALIACRRVREGFTEEQLVASRGRPLRRTSPDTASRMEVWVYRDMRVVVESGRIVSIRQQ